MKIGILTYHRAHNYGALLQAFALRNYLQRLGHQTELIDYWPKYHDEEYKLLPYFRSRRFLGKMKFILRAVIGYQRIVKRAKGYKIFIQEQLSLAENPKYITEDALKEVEYDVVVYGSDQIWRYSNYPIFKGFSDVFFGAFPIRVKRKITYAASMGIIDIKEPEKEYLRKMLQNFNSISVREQELQELVEDITGNPVHLVLDPVFLLKKEEWLKSLPSTISQIKDKYIFFYHMTPSKEAIEFTNLLKTHYGYNVIEIRGIVAPWLFGRRYFQTASPADFLALVNHAEIVVSTSFHGVAFALIFEKQFYALGMNRNSGRVKTLLDQLEISFKLLSDIKQVNLGASINYNQVNKKIANLKQESQNYLHDALSENIL